MKSPFVSDLQPDQIITGTFLVQHKDVRQKKSGDLYLSLTLADRTGELDAKMWDNAAEAIEAFAQDDFVRVKGLTDEQRWRSRYDSINDFERMLSRERTVIVKFFLHISKDAQLERFRERLEREDKHYKFSANDVRERRNWAAYQEAYEDAVNLTSKSWAPWCSPASPSSSRR